MDFIQLDISVRAVVSHKATNTTVRRLSSLTSYAKWHRLHQSEPFPPQERDIWHYLQNDQVNTGHTVASSLLEALHWAYGVLGLILQPAISTSLRLKGLVHGHSQTSPSCLLQSSNTWKRSPRHPQTPETASQLELSFSAFSAALVRATSPEPSVFTSTFQTTHETQPVFFASGAFAGSSPSVTQ